MGKTIKRKRTICPEDMPHFLCRVFKVEKAPCIELEMFDPDLEQAIADAASIAQEAFSDPEKYNSRSMPKSPKVKPSDFDIVIAVYRNLGAGAIKYSKKPASRGN